MTGGLLPRKNEQKKPFRCKIGRHSWIKDDLKASKTCKFCDATKMMDEFIIAPTRVTPWGKRKVLCKLGSHSDPNASVFGSYYCEFCVTWVGVPADGDGGGGGG